jgi:hypothetical protein
MRLKKTGFPVQPGKDNQSFPETLCHENLTNPGNRPGNIIPNIIELTFVLIDQIINFTGTTKPEKTYFS